MTPFASLKTTTTISSNPLTQIHIRVCPDCAGPIIHSSGCITCLHCGWGKCG